MCVYSLFIIPPTIFIIIIQLCSFCPSCFLNLFLDNIFAVIKQHGMQKPIEILRSHSLKNSLKSTQPCIELLTCLSIECPLLICSSISTSCHYNQVWCRPICRGCITPSSTKSVSFAMILIMITVHYKVVCDHSSQ